MAKEKEQKERTEKKDKKDKNENKDALVLPHNIEAEAVVLGSILIDDDAATEIIPMLRVDDFYMYAHRVIFNAMRNMFANGSPIDMVTLTDYLDKNEKLEEAGSVAYLSELTSGVLSPANGKHYASIVARDGLIRRVIKAGNKIVENGYDSTDGYEALREAEKIVYDLSEGANERLAAKSEDAFAMALNKINDAQIGKVDTRVIKTGFKYFDRYTHGLKPGELILIAARPSVGKTAFALNIASNVLLNPKSPKSVAIFSLEMDAPLLAKRMLAYVSNVEFDHMDKTGGLSDDEWDRLTVAYKAFINSKVTIVDDSMITPGDMLSKCRRIKSEKGLDLVIVDYLQLMSGSNKKSAESRQVEVSEMSRKMKVYAKELGCPIILLSQMSRKVEDSSREGHRPQLSDLRESGAIEQDADVVAFLSNPHKYNPALPENEIMLDIAKNRNGATGRIKLDWTGKTTTFKEIEAEDGAIVQSAAKETSGLEEITKQMQGATGMSEVSDESEPFGGGLNEIVKSEADADEFERSLGTLGAPEPPPEEIDYVGDYSDDIDEPDDLDDDLLDDDEYVDDLDD